MDYVVGYTDAVAKLDIADGGYTPADLRKFFAQRPQMQAAFNQFHLRPTALAKLVGAIGGAEIYNFGHMDVLTDMHCLHCLLTAREAVTPPPDQPQITRTQLRTLCADLDITKRPDQIMSADWIKPRDNQPDVMVDADIALGTLIHLRQAQMVTELVSDPPSGDDTYFDYYPGECEYHIAVMQWFLHDGPRMV